MIYNPDMHNRRSIRLKDYDYSQAGVYFITICTFKKECLFGDVANGKMRLNELGNVVQDEWKKTTDLRRNVELDCHAVMPNHFHGILIINRRGVLQYAPTKGEYTIENREFKSPAQTIGSIVRGFKSSVTKQINILRNTPGQPVWQRNYYEHIIRSENELQATRQYILENPLKWEMDNENPSINTVRAIGRSPVEIEKVCV